jgi:hypothetical protein
MNQIANLENLVAELGEILEEIEEKKTFHKEATEKGEGWEADQIFETIEELNLQIELYKKYIDTELKEISNYVNAY